MAGGPELCRQPTHRSSVRLRPEFDRDVPLLTLHYAGPNRVLVVSERCCPSSESQGLLRRHETLQVCDRIRSKRGGGSTRTLTNRGGGGGLARAHLRRLKQGPVIVGARDTCTLGSLKATTSGSGWRDGQLLKSGTREVDVA